MLTHDERGPPARQAHRPRHREGRRSAPIDATATGVVPRQAQVRVARAVRLAAARAPAGRAKRPLQPRHRPLRAPDGRRCRSSGDTVAELLRGARSSTRRRPFSESDPEGRVPEDASRRGAEGAARRSARTDSASAEEFDREILAIRQHGTRVPRTSRRRGPSSRAIRPSGGVRVEPRRRPAPRAAIDRQFAAAEDADARAAQPCEDDRTARGAEAGARARADARRPAPSRPRELAAAATPVSAMPAAGAAVARSAAALAAICSSVARCCAASRRRPGASRPRAAPPAAARPTRGGSRVADRRGHRRARAEPSPPLPSRLRSRSKRRSRTAPPPPDGRAPRGPRRRSRIVAPRDGPPSPRSAIAGSRSRSRPRRRRLAATPSPRRARAPAPPRRSGPRLRPRRRLRRRRPAPTDAGPDPGDDPPLRDGPGHARRGPLRARLPERGPRPGSRGRSQSFRSQSVDFEIRKHRDRALGSDHGRGLRLRDARGGAAAPATICASTADRVLQLEKRGDGWVIVAVR